MTILIVVVCLALAFDVINGFHDAANSIATIVSTKVLPPSMAVVWAAFFNFIAYLIFGLHVANTVGTGIIHPEVVTLQVLIATLLGAIIWNLITWWGGYVALIAAGQLTVHDKIPFWIVISCQCAMAVGTLMGGWRIVKTMGTRITHLRPFEGFAAETAGAITLFSTSALGIPVSTTHTITGAIIGAGATKRLSAVRWGVTTNILIAWIITIPITSVLSAFIYYILTLIF